MKVKQLSMISKQPMKNAAAVATFIAILALGISYLVWLDSGCELSGAMTWGGKVCVEDLDR